MKNVIKYSFAALLIFAGSNLYGQTPEKVIIDSKDYYQHGFNSKGVNQFDGNGKAIEKPGEAIDSVTVGSTVKYFVLPDPAISPDYKYDTQTNIYDATKLNSTFVWTLVLPGIGTPSSNTNTVEVTWGNTPATGTLNVVETPKVSAACVGSTTSISVEIIAKPTITFVKNGLVYADSACYQLVNVTNPVTINFPITVTSATKAPQQVKVNYTVTKGVTTVASGTGYLIAGGIIPVNVTEYGRYKITVAEVTDRISRKSGVASTGTELLTSGGSATFAYNVMPPAKTGPIYRLPNNGNY